MVIGGGNCNDNASSCGAGDDEVVVADEGADIDYDNVGEGRCRL